jgi:hypothetical protein
VGFYLHLEVESSLLPGEFRERVLSPLAEALEREGLGRILPNEPEDEADREGVYQVALEVTDQHRARAVVEDVLRAVTG